MTGFSAVISLISMPDLKKNGSCPSLQGKVRPEKYPCTDVRPTWIPTLTPSTTVVSISISQGLHVLTYDIRTI